MEKIKVFVFDWSGVISDDRKPVWLANISILSRFGKARMSFEEWLGKSTANVVQIVRNAGINEQEASDNRLLELYEQELNKLAERGVLPVIYDGVPEALNILIKKGKLAVLSSHPRQNLFEEAQRYNIKDFFVEIYGGIRDKVPAMKDLCSRMQVLPGEVLYVGDTIYDVDAGRDAGTRVAAVCCGYHSRERLEEKKPDLVLPNLRALADYF